ncbi:hypothetical protein [Parablautia muri]|uniref:Uncharacterized protein n=1 Tax=Parablautia muri TaxID=2320879 RepID=A0A9X5BJ58_9FIRM|nr:hypothetical protein [Parablautia muri]NBJ94664.1 hypothetical protein [Parablautia muri]
MAVFVFYYSKDDIDAGKVDRPTTWALINIENGAIIEERHSPENEFSDAGYEKSTIFVQRSNMIHQGNIIKKPL